MTHHNLLQSPADAVARKIAQRLTRGTAELDHDIVERLRIARQQAVSQRKVAEKVAAHAVVSSGGAAALQGGPGLWTRMASALPLLALIAGLLAIHVIQNDERANEVAEVDAALLTDDLPTDAYTDPGFMQFLRADSSPSQR